MTMTKSELKSGMRVTTRNGDQYIVMINPDCEERELIDIHSYGFISLSDFNDELKCISGFDDDWKWDIVKIESCSSHMVHLFSDFKKIKWVKIWEREEKLKEVTIAEIEEKFGCKVKIVDE